MRLLSLQMRGQTNSLHLSSLNQLFENAQLELPKISQLSALFRQRHSEHDIGIGQCPIQKLEIHRLCPLVGLDVPSGCVNIVVEEVRSLQIRGKNIHT